jgi:hypothetical protein
MNDPIGDGICRIRAEIAAQPSPDLRGRAAAKRNPVIAWSRLIGKSNRKTVALKRSNPIKRELSCRLTIP